MAAAASLRPNTASVCYKAPEGTALCKYPGMGNAPPCSGQGFCSYTGEGMEALIKSHPGAQQRGMHSCCGAQVHRRYRVIHRSAAHRA